MNAEGVGRTISAEWLQTVATGVPILVVAAWLLVWVGVQWRRRVWREAGSAIRTLQREFGGSVDLLWTGYRVRGQGVSIDFVGGLGGVRTRVRSPRGVVSRDGLLDAASCRALLSDAS